MAASSSSSAAASSVSEPEETFDSLGIDERLTRACKRAGFSQPTPIQSATIPLALQGRDILAKARTGSGKTVAYLLPILHKILQRASTLEPKKSLSVSRGVEAIILVPTRDLCPQVREVVNTLTIYCSRLVSAHALSGTSGTLEEQTLRLAELPSILIATPGRLAQHLRAGHLPGSQILAETLHSVVIDEADLVLSYGYEADVRSLFDYLPQRSCQTYLMSATLSGDIEKLKRVILHRPAVLQLEDPREQKNFLAEFCFYITERDKCLLMYTMIALKLLTGKIIIFCKCVSTSFRLKLYLERFGIHAIVLNSDLPENSRRHITDEFNRGMHSILIATDHHIADSTTIEDTDSDESDSEFDDSEEDESVDADSDDSDDSDDEEEDEKEAEEDEEEEEEKSTKASAKPTRASNKQQATRGGPQDDKEYGFSRGIDFHDVSVVVNFDLPRNHRQYIHRIGRTARAGKRGSALTLVAPKDDKKFERLRELRAEEGVALHNFNFKLTALEAFRYRGTDVLRSVTRGSVRRARRAAVRKEILNSTKLKEHFEDNPRDLQLLKHDKHLQMKMVRGYLKHIPDYILNSVKESTFNEHEPNDRATSKRQRKKLAGKASDPLRSLKPNYKGGKRQGKGHRGRAPKRHRK